jgi:3',5'-cyclic AMP phosphodiesterase CpdA
MSSRYMKRGGLMILAAALSFSCAGVDYRPSSDAGTTALLAQPAASFPPARFAVISDPHLYDKGLGIEGKAFEEYLADDRKLIVESEELLVAAVERVKTLGVQFLLVSGDLTKDGERQDHELLARYLGTLKDAGIPSFVIPGNHDILNPRAYGYSVAGAKKVPNVTAEEFAGIYKDFGYGSALFRDASSLSYVAEPAPGIWLLALDSCQYADNPKRKESQTDGRFGASTVTWIEDVLARAARGGIPVIAMMHHGVLEHYTGQVQYYGQYVVKDWEAFSSLLASYRVRLVFTGHYHAQDITVRTWSDGRFLYDSETGSLVTAPNPVRTVTIDGNQRLSIESSFITELPSFTAAGKDFHEYAETYLHSGISGIAIKTMKGLGVPAAEAEKLAPQVADAFAAHYNGDEKFLGVETLPSKGLSFMGGIVVANKRGLVDGLWKDLPPTDNAVSVDLRTGAWQPAP